VRGTTGKVVREDAEKVLRRKMEEAKRGDAISHEERATLAELFKLIEENYKLRRNRSIDTMGYSFKHLLAFFGQKAKAADGAPGAALGRLSPPFGLASVTC